MFKVGDKIRRIDHSQWPHKYGHKGEVYEVLDLDGIHPVVIAGYKGASSSSFELVEKKKEMTHKYNEGQWYAWDGKGTCPLHPKDEFTVKCFNTFYGEVAEHRDSFSSEFIWKWQDNKIKVFAFKITKKYKEPETVEMTVEEICKALGKNIKVVK